MGGTGAGGLGQGSGSGQVQEQCQACQPSQELPASMAMSAGMSAWRAR
jgi:hypothetical protein